MAGVTLCFTVLSSGKREKITY